MPVTSVTRSGGLESRPMARDDQDPELLRHVFERTEVLRKPLTGIIAGYHLLPYILVGPEHEHPSRSVEVRGRIPVSPRLVITPGRDGPTHGQLFGVPQLTTPPPTPPLITSRSPTPPALSTPHLR